ncbi:MAG: hypothetical protein J5590_09885 [Clostridia bacterium]|nr:hypothetical protein [Clostridia bacterium]
MNKKIITLITAVIMIFTLLPMCSVNADTGIKIGDYLQMGTYYGAPILWRCVDIDENGPLMMADRIICLKAFDAAGENTSASHGRGHFSDEMDCLNRVKEGSNYWGDSNIRCWLNSSADAGDVIWACGNAPSDDKVALNGYDNEAGFMTNFTAKELGAVKRVTQKQLLDCYENCTDGSNTPVGEYHGYKSDIDKVVQNYRFAFSEQVTDSFFLPDVKQINAVYNNSNILGEGYYIGAPTEECVKNLKCTEEISSSAKWNFWLRTPRANTNGVSANVRIVRAEGGVYAAYADQGYNGVRPAFYLNTEAFEGIYGLGTETEPFYLEKRANLLKVGDYIEMGTYYGEPILWRCVAFEKITAYDSETGIPSTDSADTVTAYENGYLPLMVSDKIICLKPFDAGVSANSASGSHSMDNYDRRARGSNYWGDSNIRSWLNSNAAAGEVIWLCGNPPDSDHVWYGYNDYADEAGFLTNFSRHERNAMQTAQQKSIVGACEWSKNYFTSGSAKHEYESLIEDVVKNYATAYSEKVTDTVFLLDVKQVNTIYNNSGILGEDYFRAELTDKAVANSNFIGRDGFAGGQKWNYWLRTPDAGIGLYGFLDKYTDYYDVGTRTVNRYRTSGQGDVSENTSNYGSIGVRPAFYLNTSTIFDVGDGSNSSPYTVFEDKTLKGKIVECRKTGAIVRVKAEVENPTEDGRLIFAAFDEGGKVIHIETAEMVDTLNDYEFSYASDDAYMQHKYKVFIWDNSMHPLGRSFKAKASDF